MKPLINRLEMIPSSALKKGIASAITQATSVMVAMRASQVSQPALVWMRRISDLGNARLRM